MSSIRFGLRVKDYRENVTNNVAIIGEEYTHLEYDEEFEKESYRIKLELFQNGEVAATMKFTVFDMERVLYGEKYEQLADYLELLEGESQDNDVIISTIQEYYDRLLPEMQDFEYLREEKKEIKDLHVYIERIYVNKNFRKMGLGNWLLGNYKLILEDHLKQRIKTACAIISPESKDLKEANLMLRLFEKYGFREFGYSRHKKISKNIRVNYDLINIRDQNRLEKLVKYREKKEEIKRKALDERKEVEDEITRMYECNDEKEFYHGLETEEEYYEAYVMKEKGKK